MDDLKKRIEEIRETAEITKGRWFQREKDVWTLYNISNRNNVAEIRKKPFSSDWIGKADLYSIVCMRTSFTRIEHSDLDVLKEVACRISNVEIEE